MQCTDFLSEQTNCHHIMIQIKVAESYSVHISTVSDIFFQLSTTCLNTVKLIKPHLFHKRNDKNCSKNDVFSIHYKKLDESLLKDTGMAWFV